MGKPKIIVEESYEEIRIPLDEEGVWYAVLSVYVGGRAYHYVKKLQAKFKKKRKKEKKKYPTKRPRFDFPRYRHPIMLWPIQYYNPGNAYCFSSPKFQAVGRRL